MIFVDEDVSGGGTAYMMQKVLEEQQAFDHLDTAPYTLPAMDTARLTTSTANISPWQRRADLRNYLPNDA